MRMEQTECSEILWSIGPASEFYVPTFRNTLIHLPCFRILCTDVSKHSDPSSLNLKFIFRRFETLWSIFPVSEFNVPTFRNTLFHLPYVWNLCTDVPKHGSIFPASVFYVRTFRNTVTSSLRLNFMYRRFETLCFIFLVSELYVPTFRNILIHLP
jgi:hypothetical protein